VNSANSGISLVDVVIPPIYPCLRGTIDV
jgi:hypothetical protein